MFNKYHDIFRSRWKALMWAAGVLLTAYCTVPQQDGSDPTVGLLKLVASQHKPPHHKPVDPWALDPKKG
jgi:hypothetical protein